MYQKTMTFTLMAVIVALQGCTTVNPYTREEETAKATKGAGIGAAIGAIAGIATSDGSRERKKRALKGAGIGALAGGGVGYYMDVQETKLRQELDGTGVSVSREGERIILNMPGNITFDVDKTNVKPNFVDVLGSVAKVLQEYEKTMIEVAGHTDSTGSDRYNQLLSEQRAQSVTNHLVEFGIKPVRIDTVGYGETMPIASNNTESGRRQNRRVELTLLPYVEE
jgi:outer membrane protein OmpA-like peptidoglycan-associated protein